MTRLTALALGLALGTAGTAAAAPSASSPPWPDPPSSAEQRSVTLITGDRVVLNGDKPGSVLRGPGRDNVGFSTYSAKGHQYVVPRDAATLLAAGKLDQRLFDVTGLVEAGYDDAKRDNVPLIVAQVPGRQGAAGALSAAGTAVTQDLPAVHSFAARTAKANATSSWGALVAESAGVRKIWLDGLRQPSLDRSVPQIGAPAAWQAGYTGTGVKVAVLDTGVDSTHPDLAGQVLAEKNFTEAPINIDDVGHGTHVAATIASRNAKYRGVAPDAKLLNGKVCQLQGCAESWILGGMQWAADQGADVVNLSLGGGDSPEIDPLEEAVNTLSAQHGMLFVIAAGNSGGPETIGSPGSADAALTVGAVDRDDNIAPFSSRGPRVGDGAVKPDITAPGVDIVAAKSSTGVIGTPAGDGYVSMSGTSMATPHVAGAAALIAQQHPDWTGAQIKAALVASAKPNPNLGANDQGAGRVDLTKAITQTVTADPANINLGLQEWPHQDDPVVTKDVGYHNSGTVPVTLDVSVDVKGPDGKAAPAGVLTVSPAKVTVPAGGDAKVTVTGDTKVGTLDGGYTGVLLATSGQSAVRSPLSITREVESYRVKLDYLDADGKPTGNFFTSLIGLDNNKFLTPSAPSGSLTVRLPKGNYIAFTEVLTDRTKIAELPYPNLVVTGDTTITFDARLAKPLKVSVPDPGARAILGDVTLSRKYQGMSFTFGGLFVDGFGDTASVAHLGPALPADQLTVQIGSQFEGTPIDPATPVAYRVAWSQQGKAPTGFVRAPRKRDLAEVRTDYGPGPAGREFLHGTTPIAPDGTGGWGWLAKVSAPGRSVDYVNGDGTRWAWDFFQGVPPEIEANWGSGFKTYKPGHKYDERFNFAVFGPTINPDTSLPLARRGDDLGFSVGLWGDGSGNQGGGNTVTARTTLFRNGQKIGETPEAGYLFLPVPAAKADYRVETEATRGYSDLSTKVSGSWTFKSEHVDGTAFKALPLSVIRFAPKLDNGNGSPAGKVLRVPLVVTQAANADNGKIRKIEVEVSFDDGKTWRKAPVAGDTALVRNPKQAGGFASLRAKATDSKGNAVDLTVIRAYKITK